MTKQNSNSWAREIPEGLFISTQPTYSTGEYLALFDEDQYSGQTLQEISMKYYFYDPTKHGYPKKDDYPLFIFLHGASNSFVGKTCINYTGAEHYASPDYQKEFKGSYLLIPIANEYQDEGNVLKGYWGEEYTTSLYSLIQEFIQKHTSGVGKKFLFGNSAGGTMTFLMGNAYTDFFDVLIPVGTTNIPDDATLDHYEECGITLFYAQGKRDEIHDFDEDVMPRLPRLQSLKRCFLYTPDWVKNGDGGIASIVAGIEMGQHCLMNAIQANLLFDDGTPMDTRLPRGLCGWLDEVNRNSLGFGREYTPHGGYLKTGYVQIEEEISLFYEEYGKGGKIILSSQVGFYHRGMHQRMAELGYHIYCITMRGFHPSTLIDEDYKDQWYDVFAKDVLAFADKMQIDHFSYMGASHGAGIGWHLMLLNSERVDAFIAVVPGPHSLRDGVMSYRQMIEQGIIEHIPPFDPPIDSDDARKKRREYREKWLSGLPTAYEAEKKLDYGRPLMRLGTEEKLCDALRTIQVPTLILGGYDDPISTPKLMMRTAGCLPHCKLVIYSNCGHNLDSDLIEEAADEADHFIENAIKTGKWYLPVQE